MIHELYVIDVKAGIPYIDQTYRKIHLGISNTLVSGLLHVVYTMFDTEMEIGHIKSLATKDYKLIYLKHQDLLFIALADIKLDENKIQETLNNIATAFWDEFESVLADWSRDITVFEPFLPKMDSMVIETIAELFFEEYPTNIVTLVDYIGKTYSLGYQELIGKALAEKILTNRYSDIGKKRNLRKELSKFTVVKNLTDNSIALSVCPFCRKKESTEPLCNFVTGFINGMLKSTEWVEKTCVGRGEDHCSFSNGS